LPELNTTPYDLRPFDIAYVGGLTEKRGARELITALTHVNRTLECRLRFAGVLRPDSLKAELEQTSGWRFVEDQGWKDREGVSRLLDSCRVGMVLFHPAANHMESQPNKLFEYMLAGLPVVASNFGHWDQFVSTLRCGIQVDPLDPSEIGDAVLWLLQHPEEAKAMGKRGRDAVLASYTWEQEFKKLLGLYRSLLSGEECS
jgi:glycosyltransferase involved in cell wall biosynthesis